MDALGTSSARWAAFAIGVASHLFIFRHGEWDLTAIPLLGFFTALHITGVIGLLQFSPGDAVGVLSAAGLVAKLELMLIAGLYTSMLVYRGFFHRLCRFPGPFLARFSNIYPTVLSAKRLHLYEEVEKLHRQYGDFVRLGPSEISINNADALTAIHGPQSPCTKGPWYNVLHPMMSLQMIRNKSEHLHRRRVWDRGFSSKALRDYEPRVTTYTDHLLAQIEKREREPVDVTDWFNFYSFDVMGDLAWGKSFGMLQNGIKHYFMKSLHADMTSIGLLGRQMWLFPVIKATPGLNYENKRFWAWLKIQVDERRQMSPDRPDVFSWLLEDHVGRKTSQQDELNLLGDAYLIAVAGSDTTAAVLTCAFFQLALQPSCVTALQEEIDPVFDGSEPVNATSLGKLTYLNAVINETMRLHPPVPSGVQRMTPPQGLTIGNTFIPGNTIVQIPHHTMYRDERYFKQADQFIPERWSTRPELIHNASVFAPFSSGRDSCIGKQLAMIEVRHVMSHLVRRYDVSFAPDQSPKAFLDGKRDTFTLALGPLNLVFSPRQKTASG